MNPLPLVLVIDDREDITAFCRRALGATYEFAHVTTWRAAEGVPGAREVAAVLLDRDFSQVPASQRLGPPDDAANEGLHILRALRRSWPKLPVVMVTGRREMSAALEAAKLGADFVAWDDVIADPGLLAARLAQAIDRASPTPGEHAALFRGQGLVAESPAFVHALEAVWEALPGNAPILLLGESGTGKTMLASAIHALSGDPNRSFVALDLVQVPATMVEAELFGHDRAAFTNADRERIGRIRAADGGTLFLDEIANLSLEFQQKLLTVIESGQVVPLGQTKPVPSSFRLITATSKDLRACMRAGQFRPDLYHRIAWHIVELPPLRERREDIAALALAHLRRLPQYLDGRVYGFARETLEYLATLSWPGNVRGLLAVVEGAAAGARHQLTVADVVEAVRRQERSLPDANEAEAAGLSSAECDARAFDGRTLAELNEAYFRRLVAKCGGRMAEVARLAGISKATAYEWKQRYGITGGEDAEGNGATPGA